MTMETKRRHESSRFIPISLLIFGVVCAVLFIVAVQQRRTLPFDEAMVRSFRNPKDLSDAIGSRFIEENVRNITGLGSTLVTTWLTAALGGFLLLRGSYRKVIFLLSSCGGAILLNSVLKSAF